MKCYCYETETEFVYCVENAQGSIRDSLCADRYWSETTDGKFVKKYPLNTGFDDAWYLDAEYKETVKRNFARLGKEWIEGIFDWRHVLNELAQAFSENDIEWYILGSASEAVLGVDITPHDIDIAVHTKDFYKAKALFRGHVIEPLSDNHGSWLVRYFGKLCLGGACVDVAADEKLNRENNPGQYEKATWNGYVVYITPLKERYETEKQRNRKGRIKAIEEFMKLSK